MRNGLVAFVASALLGMAAQGCVSVPGAGVTSASDIAVDAVALNDAFGRAMNGQILLNALRARDRWPRRYVKFTGISNQPTLSYSMGVTLSPLPFNNAPGPLRGSQGPLTRTQQSAYNYGVEPLSPADVNLLMRAVPGDAFANYWNDTGWPKDLLLLVMVASVERYNAAALTDDNLRAILRDPDSLPLGVRRSNRFTRDDADRALACDDDRGFRLPANWPSEEEEGDRNDRCAFFRIAHRLAGWPYREPQGSFSVGVRTIGEDVLCRITGVVNVESSQAALISAMNTTTANSSGGIQIQLENRGPTPVLNLRRCESGAPLLLEVRRGAVTEATYRVTLRSIDDMIYAMGTLLRPARDQDENIVERRLSRGACSDASVGFCAALPLFTAREAGVLDTSPFAARVNYQGRRYLAGPAMIDERQADADRTASVITLLSQLFTQNVQASTTPPPARVNPN